MADTRMSVEERESFLADVHIGVLSIPRKERAAPLTVPVWYDYEPGGEAWLITGQQSLKGRLLEVGTPVALVAQTEDTPYKYVSVEGRVSAIEPTSNEAPQTHGDTLSWRTEGCRLCGGQYRGSVHTCVDHTRALVHGGLREVLSYHRKCWIWLD